jgi:V-type H+-transporting ATPase proteolipid subunit
MPRSTNNSDIGGIVDPSQGYPLYSGFVHLGAGLACGATGMAAGYAIGIVGDSVRFHERRLRSLAKYSLQCVRAYVRESKVFVAMVLILIFAEVLGLYGYGFIVAAALIHRH